MSTGIDQRKAPGSVDSVMDQKFNVIVKVVDDKLDQVYKDFNLAMEAKNQQETRLEARLSNMVQVMWGLLNEQRIRLVTLEDFVIKNNVGKAEELQEQYLDNIAKFKEESGWEEVSIPQALGVNPLDSAVMTSSEDQKPF